MSKMVDAFGEVFLEAGGQYKRQTPRRTEARPAMWGLAEEPVLLVRSAAQDNGTLSRQAKLLNVQLTERRRMDRLWKRVATSTRISYLEARNFWVRQNTVLLEGCSPRRHSRQHSSEGLGCTHMSYHFRSHPIGLCRR